MTGTNAGAVAALNHQTVALMGLDVARCSQQALLDAISQDLAAGRGTWLVTANMDFLSRARRDPHIAALYRQSDLIIADGMPLVWASRLAGAPIPERIAGSSLMFELAACCARQGRSMYLLGGVDGNEARAAEALSRMYPGLRIAGHHSPWTGVPPSPVELAGIDAALTDSGDVDVILVAMGSPKQEYVAHALRRRQPQALIIGVGASFAFATGDLARAPQLMQRLGLEWAHRMLQDPRRLIRRYLMDNLPVVIRLLAASLWRRFRDWGGHRNR
ncbi:MAG: WecB/TagA/CpsF family glycosyltransferase [Abyssibacter sp.]|uniref:WecB/TagA/CpsF family glycosyltransferase n=1 Tax=Abyssibacter sp. TaxID=2320200 RepID=UPI003219E2DB